MIEKISKQILGYALLAVLAINLFWFFAWFVLASSSAFYQDVQALALTLDLYALYAFLIAVAFYFVLGMMGESGWSMLEWHHKMTKQNGLIFYAGLFGLVALLYTQSIILAAISVFLYLVLLASGQSKKTVVSAGNQPTTTSVTASRSSFITFSSVIGMDETKKRLLKAGNQILEEHKTAKSKNGLSVDARNGILLFGPPGTGKTYLAEALAGELGIGFMHFNFSQVNSRWIGEGTERVTEVFKQAIMSAPVMLFLDEVDTVFVSRADIAQAEHESGRLTSALLPLIEEARKQGVVLVAATNLLERLDPASIREGRFDFKIEVDYPDAKARKAIVEASLIKHEISVSESDVEKASSRWEGYSIPRLKSVAAELSDAGLVHANFADLMQAMRKVQGRKGSKIKAHKIDDLILSEKMRGELESLVWRLKHLDELESLGGSLPTGLLFHGDPGSGKGMAAVALANSSDWAFISVTGQELIADTSRIDEIMAEAAEIRPVLVFIDEAEDVFGQRMGGMNNTVTNKLLSVMDGVQGKVPDIIFIAATNHPDQIDSAALRGGRFTEKVYFTYPDSLQTYEYVNRWIKNKPKLSLGQGLTVDQLAQDLAGVSFANLNAILQTAANAVISKQLKIIDSNDIYQAKAKVLIG